MKNPLLLCLFACLISSAVGAEDKKSAEDPWGDWNATPNPSATGRNEFGVGISGKDEQMLNQIDGSSLLDYNHSIPSSRSTLQNKNADQLLLRKLEDALIDDLID